MGQVPPAGGRGVDARRGQALLKPGLGGWEHKAVLYSVRAWIRAVSPVFEALLARGVPVQAQKELFLDTGGSACWSSFASILMMQY